MTEAFPMVGGDGTKSYANNSTFQRACSDAVMEMIGKAIADKFDVSKLISTSNVIRIADLGCSVGPNTFFAMKNVADAIKKKCHSQLGLTSEDVEYQVLFNDHASNDFNTLFTSLFSENREYYAAGVPGSFHARLFPSSSIHFLYSANALHWISKIPRELVDQNSLAWNKGKIHYGNASDEVANAYATQFAKDMEMFLNSRAKEMVHGGLMVLIIASHSDGLHRSLMLMNLITDFLATILMEMVYLGSIKEAQLDSFNLPMYFPTVQEIKGVIAKNGCFSITTIELTTPNLQDMANTPLEGQLMFFRSAFEQVFIKHFGEKAVDEMFERALEKIIGNSKLLDPSNRTWNQSFVVLQRK